MVAKVGDFDLALRRGPTLPKPEYSDVYRIGYNAHYLFSNQPWAQLLYAHQDGSFSNHMPIENPAASEFVERIKSSHGTDSLTAKDLRKDIWLKTGKK